MREANGQVVHPELKAMVAEAVRSLAKLDADRLEELAVSCHALNCDMTPAGQHAFEREVRAAKKDMAALAQVLQATGANAAVLRQLREHSSRREYSVLREPRMREEEAAHGIR